MTDRSKREKKREATTKVKVLSAISIVLLTVAIVFCAIVIFQTATQGYVSLAGYSVFRVVTPSMEPELPVDTFIITQKVDINDIQEGDIISFISKETYLNGGVVTHRVVETKIVDGRVCLVTRGDASNSVDAAYVTSDNLVGRMVAKTEKDGFISQAYRFLNNKQVFFVFIIMPMLIVAGLLLKGGIQKIYQQISEIKQEIENDDEKSDNAMNGESKDDWKIEK